MIYLHTGCKYSKPWDDAFKAALDYHNVQYQVCDILNIKPTVDDVFIGRIDQSCRHLKYCYKSITNNLAAIWPEQLSIDLYDDKITQVDFLKKYPTPTQNVVRSEKDVSLEFPIVQKLSHGASSKNVQLIYSMKDVVYPSVHQEFCTNNDSDIRVTVIGDYVTAFRRMNRDNDFRASGSNNIIVLNDIPKELIDISFNICKENNFITMAFDFLKLRGKWVIIEMSYTYQMYGITDYCNIYFDITRNKFINGTINPAMVILDKVLTATSHKYQIHF